MKTRNKLYLLFITLTLLIPKSNMAASLEKEPALLNDLPDIQIVTTEGTNINTNELTGKVLLFLFQPDCDHCQREATDFRQHISSFKDCTVYFISSAPMAEISKFSSDFDLKGQPNIFFAYAELMDVVNTFGSLPTPSLYIYSDQQVLLKNFEGETPISKVLPYLK